MLYVAPDYVAFIFTGKSYWNYLHSYVIEELDRKMCVLLQVCTDHWTFSSITIKLIDDAICFAYLMHIVWSQIVEV